MTSFKTSIVRYRSGSKVKVVGVKVAALWRYPVKSLGGELVDTVRVGPLGFAEDRQWAIVDVGTGNAASCRRFGTWSVREPDGLGS